ILTSDNPRDEDPAAIARAIEEGLRGHPGVKVDLDRRSAIHDAILDAAPEDVVVIAGRGHETEQIVGSVVVPFSDRDAAMVTTSGMPVTGSLSYTKNEWKCTWYGSHGVLPLMSTASPGAKSSVLSARYP